MRILSIDSSLGSRLLVCRAPAPEDSADSAPGGPTALTVLFHCQEEDSRRHAESLGPMLARALADPAVASGGLDLVVAATGPAPFTGLRAGLVTARTIGRVLGVPVHGVPSLDAVARAAFDELDALNAAAGDHRPAGAGGSAVTGPDAQTVRVVTDARRKEVYTAAYRRRGADDVERVSELEVLAPAALDRVEGPRPAEVLAGSGALVYPELAGGRPVVAPVSGHALAQVRLVLARLRRGEQLDTEPLYLRHADVQMPASRKRHL